MGCIQSAEASQAKERNEVINKQLKEDKTKEHKEIKLLLLGTGESGKSTVLKQMRILHGGGYNKGDRLTSRDVIFSNVVQSMKIILEALTRFEIPLGDPSNTEHLNRIQDLYFQVTSDTFPPEIATSIKALWADTGVQKCFLRSREYQLNDSAKYYFDCIDRISALDYIPLDEDILRSRVKTTGIVESPFSVLGQQYRIYDVGGQRSERRKWIHCFENVTALFFIVAISEYDQKLVEDEQTNRVKEALTLFSSISHNRWFENISIILFLNKFDLFKYKVTVSSIEEHFPDFRHDPSRPIDEEGYEFFKSLFEAEFHSKKAVSDGSNNKLDSSANALNRETPAAVTTDNDGMGPKKNKELFVFQTCATDTTQMRNIITSVNQIIIQRNLEACGLI